MSKNICESCGSVVAPGKKVCPICGSKINQAAEPEQDLLKETQVLPDVKNLISEMSDKENVDDLDFDIPAALKMKEQSKSEKVPAQESVAPADPDLADCSEEDDEEEFPEKEAPEQEPAETEEQEEDSEKFDYSIPDFSAMPQEPWEHQEEDTMDQEEERAPVSGKDKAICVILGILVALFGMYIAYRFLQPHLSGVDSSKETTSATLCTPTITSDKVLTLPVQGEGRFLTVRLEPENSDYEVTYESADPSIATVTSDGWVTAISAGKTTVTITCQGAVAVSEIHCDFTGDATEPSKDPAATETTKPAETTKPSEPTEPSETTEPVNTEIKKLELSHTDITMFAKDEYVQLKVKGLSASQVTWTSDDSSVAEVDNGRIVAVSSGTTKIHAEYNGMEATCIVRCNIEDNDDDNQDNGSSSGELTISHTDVTMHVGESFTLRLKDSDGNTVDVAWSQGKSSVCEIDGNEITAVGEGYTEVTATYGGKTYTCVIRVI